MIRSFEVLINAAHPELPLFEASTIVGSASTAIIKRVPPKIGNWTITRVYVECQYPDNTAIVADARVGSPGVWIANLPATEYSGRVKSGFVVRADAMTEPGETMSGYILGIADFAVYTRDLVIVPGTTGYTLRYFNTAPNPPKAGDVATVDGRLRFFDGIEWILFADTTLTVTENGLVLAGQSDKPIQPAGDYPTRSEVEQEIDRLAAYYITYNAAGAAFPTRADLVNAQTYYSGGVVRVPTRNDYAVVLADEQHGGAEYRYIYAVADGQTTGQWEAQYPIETNDYTALSNKPQIGGVELSGNKTPAQLGLATSTETAALDTNKANKVNGIVEGILKIINHYVSPLDETLATLLLSRGTLWASLEPLAGLPTIKQGFEDSTYGTHYFGNNTGTVAHLENLAAEVDNTSRTYIKDNLYLKGDGTRTLTLYRCTTGYTGVFDVTKFAEATVADVLNILRGYIEAKYTKPADGIPKTDLAAAVQTSLGKADTALQSAPVASVNTKTGAVVLDGTDIKLDAQSQTTIKAAIAAVEAALPYSLATAVTIDTAQTDTSGGSTVNYGAVTCANRTDHPVAITATLDELRITFPAAVANHLRDFYLRVDVGTGSAALTAPTIVPVAPTGETITIEAPGGTMPVLADGTATAKGTTMLYFSETAPGKFWAKAETIEEVA